MWTFKNLQYTIQARIGNLRLFSLTSGPSLLWKESDLGKNESLLFASTPVKYSCGAIPKTMEFLAKSAPFYEILFNKDILNNISPLV